MVGWGTDVGGMDATFTRLWMCLFVRVCVPVCGCVCTHAHVIQASDLVVLCFKFVGSCLTGLEAPLATGILRRMPSRKLRDRHLRSVFGVGSCVKSCVCSRLFTVAVELEKDFICSTFLTQDRDRRKSQAGTEGNSVGFMKRPLYTSVRQKVRSSACLSPQNASLKTMEPSALAEKQSN